MEKGKVKFFNEDKGFGFIIKDDGTEIYVHAKDVLDKITANDKISFEIGQSKRGVTAINVKKINF